jgi:TolA-binding protein
MQDTDDELREIKREIVESRGLVIKTNHLTNALAADLKTIAKRQLTFERRAFWNSAAANVVVLVVILGSVRVAWNAQQETYKNEARNQKDKLDKLLADQKVEAERQAARLSAEGSAATFYELVRAERRQEVLDGWEGLRKLPLSRAELAFLGDAVERTRAELSVKLYHQGQDHVRSGRWQEAASQLEEALRLDPKAAHSPAAKLALGKAPAAALAPARRHPSPRRAVRGEQRSRGDGRRHVLASRVLRRRGGVERGQGRAEAAHQALPRQPPRQRRAHDAGRHLGEALTWARRPCRPCGALSRAGSFRDHEALVHGDGGGAVYAGVRGQGDPDGAGAATGSATSSAATGATSAASASERHEPSAHERRLGLGGCRQGKARRAPSAGPGRAR